MNSMNFFFILLDKKGKIFFSFCSLYLGVPETLYNICSGWPSIDCLIRQYFFLCKWTKSKWNRSIYTHTQQERKWKSLNILFSHFSLLDQTSTIDKKEKNPEPKKTLSISRKKIFFIQIFYLNRRLSKNFFIDHFFGGGEQMKP